MNKEVSKISQLPPEQLEWLISVKNLYKTEFYSNTINTEELVNNIKTKAMEKGYSKIDLLNPTILETFFKS